MKKEKLKNGVYFDVPDNPPCIYEGSEPPKNFALKTWPNLLVLYNILR